MVSRTRFIHTGMGFMQAVALAGEEAFLTFETFLPSTALAAEGTEKVGLGWARCLESAAT